MASQAVSVQQKTVTLRPTPPPNTAVGGKPVAVVVGAGPAGVAAAAALATRGFSVEVFERREELTNTTKSRRGYPMVLNGRSTSTLEMAGLDLSSIGATVPQEGMVFNGTATMRYPKAEGGAGSPGPSYVVDRQSLGHGMYKAVASQQHAGSNNIRWHWGQGLDALDLKARCAWFKSQTPTGDAVQTAVSYDLLVGADGYQSAVRQTLEKEQVLDTESLVVSQGTYKTFHNLEVTEQSELLIPGLRTHAPNQYVYFFVKPGMPSLTMWKADETTMSGMVGGSVGYGDKELTNALDKMISTAPLEWRASIVAQTLEGAGQPPAPFGQVLKVSQFHGPNCVLLGDAAHPVTSGLGQGCNLALESVRVFIDTLDSVGLEAAPAAFTKARLQDAHAFQTLEFSQVMAAAKQPTIIKGQNRMPSPVEKGLALLLLQLSWAPALALHRLLPSFFSQPALLSGILRNQQIPFSKALATLRLQAGLVAASAIAGLMIAASLATKLAATVLTKVAMA